MRSLIKNILKALGLLPFVSKYYIKFIRARRAWSESGRQVHDNFIEFAFKDDHSAIAQALAFKIGSRSEKPRLIGPARKIDPLRDELAGMGIEVECVNWSLTDPLTGSGPGPGIFCDAPLSYEDWSKFDQLRAKGDVETLWELVYPYSLLKDTLDRFVYNTSSMREALEVYRGRSEMSGLGHRSNDQLNRIGEFFTFKDKSLIEFGPSDGNRTSDLLSMGVSDILAVEGNPENVMKLLVAKYMMNWDNFSIVMDNFQSRGEWTRRKYDMAYAQGVYYHCQNPLLFIEILTQISDVIFIGGWGATDQKPDTPWVDLEYNGKTYRGKAYAEGDYHFLAGLAPISYCMDREEIGRFLNDLGFTVKFSDSRSHEDELSNEWIEILAMRE